jgi:integrase
LANPPRVDEDLAKLKDKWKQMNPLDQAKAIDRLKKSDMSFNQIARRIGRSPSSVRFVHKFLEASLPDQINARLGKISTQPLQPDMILKNHIRPVLKKMGVNKRIGWHSFRHGLGTMLRQSKVDVKVAQEILRHANPAVTMGLYQQAVTDEKREAQDLAVRKFWGWGGENSLAPSETRISDDAEEMILGIA